MALALTSIPTTFGSGGANIVDGDPLLKDILQEHKDGLEELETAQAAALQAAVDVAAGNTAISKKTVTINDEDAAMTGASRVVNIGTALPANAVVLAHEIAIVQQFAGEADTAITIGGTDADAIVASTDLDALSAGSYSGTLGVHPTGKFSSQQLTATITATALEDLSAGQAVITVWYIVLA